MISEKRRPPIDAVITDIEEAGEAAADLIGRGRKAWEDDVLHRLAGEAVIGRIADATTRLPKEIKNSMPDVPWDDIRDIRILVDHIYHRVDYEILWRTLTEDVPHLRRKLKDFGRTP